MCSPWKEDKSRVVPLKCLQGRCASPAPGCSPCPPGTCCPVGSTAAAPELPVLSWGSVWGGWGCHCSWTPANGEGGLGCSSESAPFYSCLPLSPCIGKDEDRGKACSEAQQLCSRPCPRAQAVLSLHSLREGCRAVFQRSLEGHWSTRAAGEPLARPVAVAWWLWRPSPGCSLTPLTLWRAQ